MLKLSSVVAGCWRMAEWGQTTAERVRWIEQCLAVGITSFDHADIYGGYTVEGLFGDALGSAPGLRGRIQIVTKCGIKLVSPQRPDNRFHCYDTSRVHVRASVEQSLRAFGTDHIDLLLIHRADPLMQPDELASTFDELKREGKVLAFGVSNHSPTQLALLHRWHALVTHQIELSPLQMRALADGTLDQCTDLGLRPMIWSPLARGDLFNAQHDQAWRVRAVLDQLAERHGQSPATIAYAWILRHPSRPVPITGSRRVEALCEAVAALGVKLTTEEWTMVWQASMGHEVP